MEDTVSPDNLSGDYESQSPVRNDGHNSIVETSENTDPTTVPLRRSTCVRKPVDTYRVVPYKYVLLHVSCYLTWCAFACVELHTEMCYCMCRFSCRGANVLLGAILFSCSVTRASAFLLWTVNCLACVDCLRHGVGSLRFQLCSEVAVRLTTLMLFHSLYVAWSFTADSTTKFNKAFIRSHQFETFFHNL